MFNVLLPLLLLLLLPAAVQAEDYNYTTNNGTITITGYTGPGGAVTIPGTINGLPVTSIRSNAFYRCTSLTNLTIGTNVISIGGWAFFDCYSLASVTIPNSVISIESLAFAFCTNLASITIPNSVTNIGNYAFSECTSLTSVTIGNSVTSIGYGAFDGCSSLTSATIPSSVTSIGQGPFGGPFVLCSSLTAITVDTNNPVYSSVDGVLFNKNQTALIRYPAGKAGSQYTIPDSVTTIEGSYGWSGEGGAFAYCTSLTNVTVGNSVTSIGEAAFSSCTSLTSITIPNSVASIGYAALSRCFSLSSVFIPNSVTSIGVFAFEWCTNLRAITVDALNSMYSSVDGVLFNKSQTTLIQCPGRKSGSDYMIPNGVTSIEGGALWGCTSLTSITIPNSVTDIGSWSFSSCSSLTNATIPDSVTSIGYGAFYGCSSLTSATIPSSVTTIGDEAFYRCTSLTRVTIGTSVTSIGDCAFYSCTNLTNVTIPDSVTSIGDMAFRCCTNLTGVHFKGNAPSLGGAYVFDGDNNATVYYLPGTTGWTSTFGGLPTALWFLPNPLILNNSPSFGIQTNGFGFIISWATNIPVVVEACANLANHTWSPISTNNLINGAAYFSDPQWRNYPGRFYRLRSP